MSRTYEKAKEGAAALVEKLSKGDLEWEPHIWENLGWHYSACSKCGRFDVSEHKYDLGGPWSYHAFLNAPSDLPGGKWVGKAETGLEAIEDARRQAREHLETYAVCIDMKLVPIGDASSRVVAGKVDTLERDFIYLAAPYSHRDEAVRKARFIEITRAASYLIREGYMIFSPITHFHPMERYGGLPEGWEFWKSIDETYLNHSKEMLILGLKSWEKSTGVTAEIAICGRLGIPISLVDPDTYQVKGM